MVFRMFFRAPDLKHILQKLNMFGQRVIIQPVPVVSECLGHFVPIYSTALSLLSWLTLILTLVFPKKITILYIFKQQQKSDKFFRDPSLQFSFALFLLLTIYRNVNFFGKIDW